MSLFQPMPQGVPPDMSVMYPQGTPKPSSPQIPQGTPPNVDPGMDPSGMPLEQQAVNQPPSYTGQPLLDKYIHMFIGQSA